MKLFAGESIAYGLECLESLLLSEKSKHRKNNMNLKAPRQ